MPNFTIEPFEGQTEFFKDFFGDIKEGIVEAVKDTDMTKLSKINAQFRRGFGIVISDFDMLSLTHNRLCIHFGITSKKLYNPLGATAM